MIKLGARVCSDISCHSHPPQGSPPCWACSMDIQRNFRSRSEGKILPSFMALLHRRQGREVSLKINSLATKTQKCLTEHGYRCRQKRTAALSYGVRLLWCLHGLFCSVCSGVCTFWDGAHTRLFVFNMEGPGLRPCRSIWSIEH